MRKSHHSLHGLLRRSLLRSVVCMILPVCVLAGLLVVLTQRYDADIALTTRASEVRTVLVQDLPDEVWNVVSGRISFEDGRQRMLIDSALWELNDMLDSAGEDEAQYLNAALRAIRTIDSYVDQLETQMDAGAAVSRNESLYREIHSVGHLAGSMLDRYIENEIARMGRFNACIQHGLGAAALALIALVGVMIWLTIRASDNLEGAIGASLRQLEQFANRIAAGELTERVPPTEIDELHLLTRDLNTMAEQLGALIHERVEQEKTIKKAELRALQAQITPHFMINCLNTIYQLTENNHADLARQMLQNLSVHLRYTLSSGQTVSLLEELNLVKNYVELSSIRYPGALRLLTSCEESLHNATVVPLMLLNFVENTIKYEVVMGKVLDMHIDITAQEENQCTRLHICIWDTGCGFSEDILAVLQKLETYVNSEQEHIGITNVVLRLRQIFPDAAFAFGNRPGAGAQITIDFPYVPFFRIDG